MRAPLLEAAAEERWALVAGAERALHAGVAAELEQLAAERARVEHDLVGGGPDALLALRGAAQAIALRQESVGRLRAQLEHDFVEAAEQAYEGPSPSELGRLADEADQASRAAARERDDLCERVALARGRLAALEGSLAEREGIPPAARALVEGGERLVLNEIDAAPGDERAVAAALGHLASAVVAGDAARGLELVRQAQSSGLGSLVVLVGKDPHALVESLPVVGAEELLASPVPAVTRDGIGWDPARGELRFAGETAEALLLELEAKRRDSVEELARLEERAEAAVQAADTAAVRASDAAAAFAPVAHLRGMRRRDPELLAAVARGAARLDETLRLSAALAGRLVQPLAERSAAASRDLGELRTRESQLRQTLSEIDGRARAAERNAGGRVVDASGNPDELRLDAERLGQAVEDAAAVERAAADQAAASSRALAEARGAAARKVDTLLLERLASAAQRLQGALTVDVAPFEAAVKQRVEADGARTAELGAALRTLGAREADLRGKVTAAAERLSALDVELARIEAERGEATRRFEAAGAEPAEGDDRDELATRLERLERRREQLGQVNPLAKEEHDAEKERLDELEAQREDLERSLAELEKLRHELTETVEKRFEETFTAVQQHFSEVAASLFPGGEGRLRLTEPEDGDEDAEPGIEVELRPAGKRVTRLSLLSGGEKALGALAFLFSLFLSRPSPFYLLDEVEAALDDTNIGRFTELLRRYADSAQFIVVTHQKRTMEAADVLYGVTMGVEGVSQIVSRRLPHEEPLAATA